MLAYHLRMSVGKAGRWQGRVRGRRDVYHHMNHVPRQSPCLVHVKESEMPMGGKRRRQARH